MSIQSDDSAIVLSGDCPVEDAEPLLALLLDDAGRPVDLEQVTRLHTAVVQVLLAARPRLRGVPAGTFAATWLLPLLLDAGGESISTREAIVSERLGPRVSPPAPRSKE